MSSLIGERIGKYEVVQVVGQGGMATVYKAYQPDMERFVAIKLLPRRLSEDTTFLRRFQREARVIANLEHRSILPVYDYGEHENMPYIVMRFISTGTLRKKMFYEDIELDVAADIIGQVAEALDYAHTKNVIHRDMKPSNILLDAQDNAYLTDFGIAKMLGGSTSYMTDGSGVIGTPSYMSPEQCQGKELGPPTDIYALGAILYEILTGAPPYIADTPLTVMYMHVRDPIPKPTLENPNLPSSMDAVFERILAKKPEERYPTAVAFAEAFRKALETGTDRIPTAISSGPRPPVPSEPTPLSGGFDPIRESSDYRPIVMPDAAIEEVEGDIILPSIPEPARPPAGDVSIPPPPPPASSDYYSEAASFPDDSPVAKTPGERSGVSIVLASIFGIAAIIGTIGLGLLFFSSLNDDGGGVALAPVLPTNSPEPTTFIVVVVTNSPTPTATGQLLQPTGSVAASTGETPQAIVVPSLTPQPSDAGSAVSPTPTATLRPTGTPVRTPTPTLTRTPTATATEEEDDDDDGPIDDIDGRGQLAFTEGGGENAEIVVIDVDGSDRTRLTDNNYYDAEPDWSGNGNQLVFESRPGDNIDLYIASADGSNRRQLTNSPADDRHPSWSPSGNVIVFESGIGDESEIYAINSDGSNLRQITDNNVSDRAPQFSNDGDRIVYMTNQRGGWEIAILDFSDGEQLDIFECPAPDCRFPAWSPDDDFVVFNTLDSTRRVEDEIWRLDVDSGDSARLVAGEDNGRATWSEDDYIYFNRTPEGGGTTLLYQFDVSSRTILSILDSSRPASYGPDWID